MLFNSLTFIVFFIIVLGLHYIPFSWRIKKSNLLIASYLFYAAWNPPFVLILWISTVVDWFVAKAIFLEKRVSKRRALLALSIIVNLGFLGFFKYGNFLMENWIWLMNQFGIKWVAADWSIVLPVGISFYTFQTMAYSLDIYLKRAKPANSFLDFALFVTFFPQLVAGPIVRPTQLIPQFLKPHVASLKQLSWGISLMILGIFQKVVIADGLLAPSSDMVFDTEKSVSFLDAWLGTLAFSGQIFSDFAGYSTTAIGVALTLGFSLPDNFRFPYAAIGFSDFWRRWHISLSAWLRDYLYIPLGGNRKGNIRTYANLMVTMLLGGLWHGASWTFVIWGGLHGLYLAAERLLTAFYGTKKFVQTWVFRVTAALFTYFLVNITWVFFRAQDFPTAWRMIKSMFGFAPDAAETPLPTLYVVQVITTIVLLVGAHWYMRDISIEKATNRIPNWLIVFMLALMTFLIIITQGSGDAFIYFQF